MGVSIGRILCPVDFSECSEHALRWAISFAERFGADITLLHVHQPAAHAIPAVELLPEVGTDQDLRQHLSRELEALAKRYSGHGVSIEPKLSEGVPYELIVEAAKDADFVVIGTHGRTGMRRLLLGSIAERVIRLSPVPTCTVRMEQPN
jgi:nucleotide-binding universal stress UspA family protein